MLHFIERHAEHVARLLELAEPDELPTFMSTLSTGQAAGIFKHLGKHSACQCLVALEPERAIQIITALPVQAAAALVRDMPVAAKKTILAGEGVPYQLKTILRYPKGSVGAGMDGNALTLTDGMTVKQARAYLKKYQEQVFDPLFVTDNQQQFVGVVALKDLLCADDAIRLALLCRQPTARLSPRETLEHSANNPAWKQVSALPVVTRDGRIAGVLHRDRLLESLDTASAATAQAGDITDGVLSFSELFWRACADMLCGCHTPAKRA